MHNQINSRLDSVFIMSIILMMTTTLRCMILLASLAQGRPFYLSEELGGNVDAEQFHDLPYHQPPVHQDPFYSDLSARPPVLQEPTYQDHLYEQPGVPGVQDPNFQSYVQPDLAPNVYPDSSHHLLSDNIFKAIPDFKGTGQLLNPLQPVTIGDKSPSAIDISIPNPQPIVHSREAFPQWLHEITGMSHWPAENPPYIPMASINLSLVPNDIPQRNLGDCSGIEKAHCSFDCHQCVAVEEVATCANISQTFDDGPSPSTPKLLAELTGRTTFFTQGINVIRFPNIFRQQHAGGHLLASHTWSHAHLPGLSSEDIAAQIQWSIWAMNATAGVVPRYFRPPYGAIDDRVRAVTRQFGLVAVFWDRDTYDWRLNDNSKTEDEVYNDVKRWQNEARNALLLEHDSTIKTVNAGIDISKILGESQMTVAECAGGPWYQNQ